MFSEVPEIRASVMTCGRVHLSSIFYQANLWTPLCVNSGREVSSTYHLSENVGFTLKRCRIYVLWNNFALSFVLPSCQSDNLVGISFLFLILETI